MSKKRNIEPGKLGQLLFIKQQIDFYMVAFARCDYGACRDVLCVIIEYFENNIKPKEK